MNIGIKPSQSNKALVLSSQDTGWNGILVEQYQLGLTPSEIDIPARSDHFLNVHLGQPVRLTQKHDNRWYESTVHKGNSSFVPARQPSYWRCHGSDTHEPMLHIHLMTTDLALANIASQVKFSSQSHLTWHCKRLTGMTSKQIDKTVRI
jgi:AraC family transcriptional regulator